MYTIKDSDSSKYIHCGKISFFDNLFADCGSGHYGYRCGQACSGHCLNNAVCDYIEGRCRDGCQPGYIGKLCNDSKIFKSSFHSVRVNSFVNDYVSRKYILFFSL